VICGDSGDYKIFLLLIPIGKFVEKLTGNSTLAISTHGLDS
jgi:hypothetical protein